MAEEVTSIKWHPGFCSYVNVDYLSILWYAIIEEDRKGADALWQKKSRV